MTNDSRRPDVAVFIDFENVYVSVRDKLDANPNFEMIMDRCEDFGRVVIARAYADWYRYPRVTSALYANSIEPMYVPTYYYDREMGRTGRAIKNSVDMNLCIDAMKTLFTNPNIAKFVLATGDRDFIPLVNSIRQQGKEVIIIGIGGAASAHLAQSADEFIFYESLVGKKPSTLQSDLPKAKMPEKGREYAEAEEDEQPAPPRNRERERERAPEREPEAPRTESPAPTDIYDTLVSAINLARERGYVCSFGSLKLLMKELMGGDFKEARYKDASGRPFAKFKDFVLEAERRGKVQVFTSGTVNEVFLPGEDPYKLSQFAQEIKEEPGSPVIDTTEIELAPEARGSSIASNGRRRRRRRGGQRASQNGAAQGETIDGDIEESEDSELPDLAELPELFLPELSAAGVTITDTNADAVFEELLERVEEEQSESETMAEIVEDEAQAIAQQATEEQAEATQPAAAEAQPFVSQPFTDGDWEVLREHMSRFGRPVSFVQIHDSLRSARNSLGMNRTNEELRSLIKQAINSGMLERIGKGNRATYQLAASADQAEQIAAVADTTEDAASAQGTPPAAEEPEFHTPTAAVEANVVEADAEPAAVEVEAPPKRSRAPRKSAAKATAPEAATPAKPKRSSRSKAAQAAEPAPAAETVEATPDKPKRSRRKKPATAE